jgi:hypothetical protein
MKYFRKITRCAPAAAILAGASGWADVFSDC